MALVAGASLSAETSNRGSRPIHEGIKRHQPANSYEECNFSSQLGPEPETQEERTNHEHQMKISYIPPSGTTSLRRKSIIRGTATIRNAASLEYGSREPPAPSVISSAMDFLI